MTAYFTNCTTAEELKKEYHKLAIMFHPDNNIGNQDWATEEKGVGSFFISFHIKKF